MSDPCVPDRNIQTGAIPRLGTLTVSARAVAARLPLADVLMATALTTLFGSHARSLKTLCVVIPAYNEELLVGRCIASVLRAGVPADQVFVINDCSSDGTAGILKTISGVNVVHNVERLGKIRSLQRVIEMHRLAERFEFMSLLDADSYVGPEYFDAVLQRFGTRQEVALVCGTPRSERHNWITAFRTLEYAMSSWVFREAQDVLRVITVAPGCASTYRTSLLEHLTWDGGTLVEDMDLTVQIHRKRLGEIAFAPDAIAFTQDPHSVRGYIGQVTRWYSGTWQVLRLHRLPLGRQRVDAEVALLSGEGLVYSVLTMLMPILALFWPGVILRWFLVDQLVVLGSALVWAWHLRRADVLIWSPTYVFFRVLNAVLLVKTFWLEMVRRQTLTSWFSVDRYDRCRPQPVLRQEEIRA
jgi:cellulose synthase/poly-beta-1,6-N-acetylglucosamine synthase-like glycosyltransferase